MNRLSMFITGIVLLSLSTAKLASAETALPSLPIETQCAFLGLFEQEKSLNGLEDPLESNGAFYFHCEHGVIWKSVLPIAESLIFRKDGIAFTLDQQNQPREIESPQSKVLGRLLNDLIGADFKQLAKTFDLEQLDQNSVRFTPRKRRLKCALKMVDLAVKDTSSNSVKIDIVDRNNQLTSVVAVQSLVLKTLSDKDTLQDQCAMSNQFTRQECSLLIDSQN